MSVDTTRTAGTSPLLSSNDETALSLRNERGQVGASTPTKQHSSSMSLFRSQSDANDSQLEQKVQSLGS